MKTKWLLCPICGNKTRLQIRRLKEVAAMKHIRIDKIRRSLTYQKKPDHRRGKFYP
ncbi:cysteine-rich KTR domain-containing protein [Helicobacter ganmani]|uniref:cysteine-rich KTR domain-containing protein n=1 Tax=Helicobacter ganmani TaxID=60246 RepID=UPI003A881647